MKFNMKSLCFIGVLAAILCLCDAMAGTEPCPAGCFCLDNGMYQSGGHVNPSSYGGKNYCGQGTPEIQKSSNKYDYETIVMAATGTNSSNYIDINLDKAYMLKIPSGNGETYINYYGIKDGVFYGDKITGNMFVCPMSHSYSDPKSKSLADCFTYDTNGDKIYYDGSINYRSCDVDGIRKTVENLQQALIKAAQDLEEALNKASATSSKTNNTSTTTSNTSSNADAQTKVSKTAKEKIIQPGKIKRASSNKSLDNSMDAAKAAISAGI